MGCGIRRAGERGVLVGGAVRCGAVWLEVAGRGREREGKTLL